jgi:hypothetical protein
MFSVFMFYVFSFLFSVDRLGRLVCGGGSVCVYVRAQVPDAPGSASASSGGGIGPIPPAIPERSRCLTV